MEIGRSIVFLLLLCKVALILNVIIATKVLLVSACMPSSSPCHMMTLGVLELRRGLKMNRQVLVYLFKTKILYLKCSHLS